MSTYEHLAAIPTNDDIQAFIIAIRSGSIEKMKEMLEIFKENISNKLQSQQRQPPLYFAAINSDEELSYQMVKLLIEAGGNPNFKDSNEQTIIFYAFRDGKYNLVKYLLSKGCKLFQEDLYGQTPIYYAASQNRLQLLNFFNSASKSMNQIVNHTDKLAKQTPLFYSASKGHLQMCKQLVKRGCNVNHHDSRNKTAVQYAKKAHFQEVVEFLTGEMKKVKQMQKVQSQIIQQSSFTDNANKQKKKKDNSQLNMNKNLYKLSYYKQNGQLHDLTQLQLKQFLEKNPHLQNYLFKPDNITQEMLQATLEESWKKCAQKILTQCWKLKNSHWFFEPVDPIKYGITDYFDIVTEPMDLGTIKKKLNYNAYENPKEFKYDMTLIWKNSYRYNGQSHEVSLSAKQIQKTFNEGILSTGLYKFIEE